MKKAICLQHVPFEGPGLFGDFLAEAGYEVTCHLVPEEGLPKVPGDFLLVMGGPMSVNDSDKWIARELAFIRKAVEAGTPYLGICLGSQFLARAIGGSVGPGRAPEIGLTPIFLTEAGRSHPLTEDLPEALRVFEWHGEGITVPDKATVLASSALFDVQAFTYKNALGLLFHLELTREGIESLCENCPEDLTKAGRYGSDVIRSAASALEGLHEVARRILLRVAS